MFRGLFEGWHLVVVLLVVLLVFGANRLPGAARNVAQSLKIFKRELDGSDDTAKGPTAGPAATAPPAAPDVPPTPPAAPPAAQPGTTPPAAGPSTPPPAAGGPAAQA